MTQPFMTTCRAIFFLLIIGAGYGCNPVYSPPIRSVHFGSPRSQRPKSVEVGGATNLYLSGGPWVSIPISHNLQLDLAGELRFVDDDNWGIGSAGLRYLLGGGDGSCTGWRGDIEFGVGVGAGGVDERELETRTSSLKWDERFVYGAFAGGGVAYHFRSWFSWFMRGRLQVSKAEFIPATFWLSGLTGPQFTAGPVSLYISCGVGYYVNELDEEVGLLPEAGLTLRFGTGGG